jgi:hypothetical protein
MSKPRVYFRYVESGVQGLVEFYDEFAPTTCETLWNALERPVRAEAFHAMSSGPEIMIGVPPEAQTFDPARSRPRTSRVSRPPANASGSIKRLMLSMVLPRNCGSWGSSTRPAAAFSAWPVGRPATSGAE